MNRKPLFDTIRKILGRGFRQSEVDRLDAAIDAVSAATSPSGELFQGRGVSERGLRLIRDFEGCARIRQDGLVEAYPDPGTGADPWTIGWGATGPGIGPGTVWTQEQCDNRLEEDVARHARDVATALGERKRRRRNSMPSSAFITTRARLPVRLCCAFTGQENMVKPLPNLRGGIAPAAASSWVWSAAARPRLRSTARSERRRTPPIPLVERHGTVGPAPPLQGRRSILNA